MPVKKKILIDLSMLRNIYCGLGQVSLNYGRYYRDFYQASDEYDIYLMLPRKMMGAFGHEVKYIESNWIRRFFPWFIPRFDVWHSIQQLSRLRSIYPSTRVILTIHDLNYLYEKKGKKLEKYHLKIQKRVDRAHVITTISEFTKHDIEKNLRLNGKTVRVIYNGVEKLNENQARQPAFVEPGTPFFFSIGQVKPKKNFHVLLPLMSYFPDHNLYIAGFKDTAYASQIQLKIDTDKLTNVFLSGKIDDDEKIWLYKHCDAFFIPSLLEGFGLPVIEALSFGKKVFSSPETSLREVGKDFVFFWNDFNAENMKNLVVENVKQTDNEDEIRNRRIKYASSFSYVTHIETYLQIYKNEIAAL